MAENRISINTQSTTKRIVKILLGLVFTGIGIVFLLLTFRLSDTQDLIYAISFAILFIFMGLVFIGFYRKAYFCIDQNKVIISSGIFYPIKSTFYDINSFDGVIVLRNIVSVKGPYKDRISYVVSMSGKQRNRSSDLKERSGYTTFRQKIAEYKEPELARLAAEKIAKHISYPLEDYSSGIVKRSPDELDLSLAERLALQKKHPPKPKKPKKSTLDPRVISNNIYVPLPRKWPLHDVVGIIISIGLITYDHSQLLKYVPPEYESTGVYVVIAISFILLLIFSNNLFRQKIVKASKQQLSIYWKFVINWPGQSIPHNKIEELIKKTDSLVVLGDGQRIVIPMSSNTADRDYLYDILLYVLGRS